MFHRFIGIVLLIFTFIAIPQAHAQETPKTGEIFPAATLPVPDDDGARAYLGLAEGKTFGLDQVKGQYIIIEIFSMYCPHCQREAPSLNAFYERLEKSPHLMKKVKLIGIGAGNSPYEVRFFQNKYDVRFPLFPDSDFAIHKAVGEVRTPYFFGLEKNESGKMEVFFSKLGGAEDSKKLLEEMIKSANLKWE